MKRTKSISGAASASRASASRASASRASASRASASRASASPATASAATASLRTFRFFGGKGGVGKTTCASAAAIQSANLGHSVLIVSTDPAHSLGDALGRKLSATPARIRTKRGILYAVELDADRALSRWLKARQQALELIAEHGTYLDTEDIHRLLELSLPGVDEMVGLLELRRLSLAREYDEVIVDTAPTGHTLRLLETPETWQRIAGVFADMQAKHRFLSESLGGRLRPDAGDALIDEIERESEGMTASLRDPAQTTFHWVLLPELLSVAETVDGVRALEEQGIAVAELIVNCVLAKASTRCRFCNARVRAESQAMKQVRKAFPHLPVTVIAERPAAAVRGARAAKVAASKTSSHRAGIATLAASTQLLIFAGKGGVGKTTCAAAAALALVDRTGGAVGRASKSGARRDRRTLLLSTDPAHSLADVLGLPLTDADHAVPGYPSLYAREMDAQQRFRDRRERYRESINELFSTLQSGSSRSSVGVDIAYDHAVASDLIDLSPPGLDEIFGILSVSEALLPREASRDGQAPEYDPHYDMVILDTAPTGHALRLLEMPDKALDWVRTLLAILLKYREVTGLGSLASELLEAARHMRQLLELLRDPAACRVIAVTRAAALPRAETERLLRRVKQLKMNVAAVMVNALTSPACARCRRVAAAEQGELSALPRTIPRILAPAIAPPPVGVKQLRSWATTWA